MHVFMCDRPAVHGDGPPVGGVEELDLADEAQEPRGVAGHAVVGPAGEVELTDLPNLVVALLGGTETRQSAHYHWRPRKLTGMMALGCGASFFFYRLFPKRSACSFLYSSCHNAKVDVVVVTKYVKT